MSTQKRENRWQRITCTERAGIPGAPGDRASSSGLSGWALPSPANVARYVCAIASGGTAPFMSMVLSVWVWLATKFLQTDQPIRQLVRPALKAHRRGSPPPGACRHAVLGTLASPRSSLPPIPFPPGFAPFRLHLPQAPAGYRRRAERYDGKGNMYLLYAA